MFCSHGVSLGIKSRCDALFETAESLCFDLSVLGLELNSWLGPWRFQSCTFLHVSSKMSELHSRLNGRITLLFLEVISSHWTILVLFVCFSHLRVDQPLI